MELQLLENISFQFLIGKVQQKWKRYMDLNWQPELFQFLIGKVQQNKEPEAYFLLYNGRFMCFNSS